MNIRIQSRMYIFIEYVHSFASFISRPICASIVYLFSLTFFFVFVVVVVQRPKPENLIIDFLGINKCSPVRAHTPRGAARRVAPSKALGNFLI